MHVLIMRNLEVESSRRQLSCDFEALYRNLCCVRV